MNGANDEVFVTFDGQSGHALEDGDMILVSRAERPLRLIRASSRTLLRRAPAEIEVERAVTFGSGLSGVGVRGSGPESGRGSGLGIRDSGSRDSP